ncbi:MAG: DUF1501 domain-containing protein [Chthonomonas sp.]|nr:DUF1501 domain-containing protein [Chthonomonas sp.]
MNDPWMTCEGRYEPGVSRRTLLKGAGVGAAAWLAGKLPALAQITVKPGQLGGPVLVSIFLRGGADGLNMVVPHGDPDYYRLRPTLALAKKDTLSLGDFFGLNPALRPMMTDFEAGDLAILHAVGSADETRSHFEAMNAMERGQAKSRDGNSNGWLTRYLANSPSENTSPLRAVAFGSVMPDALLGAPHALAMQSLEDFRLVTAGEGQEAAVTAWLQEIYAAENDAMAHAGHETLRVMESLHRLEPKQYRPAAGANYPTSDLGESLKQLAFLIKHDIGVEVACLDKGGWDTHVAQGSTAGWLTYLLEDLAKSLAAFTRDLGDAMHRVTVVVQTEFGRRAYENTQLGTDHGRGSVMFVLGKGIRGGQVLADWPGLKDDQLDGPGDLKVTRDYRDVLAELIQQRQGLRDARSVFPGSMLRPVGLA